MTKTNLGFRAWFYFRQGWGTYFAFIIAAVNTMVTTYYLAIDKASVLKIIFPSFIIYGMFWIAVGIPLLITIGYIHYKRSPAFSAEADISAESNPYFFKLIPGYNKDVLFPMHLLMMNMFIKLSKNEKLNDEEIKEISEIQKNLQILIDGGYVGKPDKSKKK
jgi:hypothetical protein